MTAITGESRRVKWEVLPIRKRDLAALAPDRWQVTRDGERIATRPTKAKALELAVTTARCAWKTKGTLATLKVKGRSGRITDERTYGRDPETTKG